MNNDTKKRLSNLPSKLLLSLIFFLGLVLGFPVIDEIGDVLVKDSEARIGRPATPRSGAGVVRRTSRRTTRRAVHRHHAVGAAAVGAYAVGRRFYALPTGCGSIIVGGVRYYRCTDVYYRPYYEGATVVYVVVDAP